MTKKKTIFITIISVIIFLLLITLLIGLNTKTQVKELFKMNKELQEENYYMAEFEFKMLGISYLLDKGHYYASFKKINELHNQMQTREGLIKMPEFKTKEEELEFYLNLQNPKTGAFIDDSYPLNTYHEPTVNVLIHLNALSDEIGQPLKLKYPLYYLDNINTIEKLIPILEDWSTIGWLGSKFPQTSFHNVRDLLSLARDFEHHNGTELDMVIQEHKLYNFSQEWKHEMLQWYYDYQDPETGTWGPKSKSGKLRKIDLSNTASIIKTFVDREGNNIYEEFPIKYRDELFATILLELDRETPKNEDDLDEWHEWGLETPKGLRTLTRYLWKNVSDENQQNAKKLIEKYIIVKFEKFYISEEGAFSYYPNGEHATIDGTGGGLSSLKEFGAFSIEEQTKLWGSPEENIQDLGILKTSEIKDEYFSFVTNSEVNSLRIYLLPSNYENLNLNVHGVIYPKETKVLDAVDLIPRIKKWVATTDQTLGNWVSKEELKKELDNIQIEEALIYNEIPFEVLNKYLKENNQLVIIGFDVLQIPKYKIVFEFEK